MRKISLIFCLLLLALQIQFPLGLARKIVIRNNCSYTVWPAYYPASAPIPPLKNRQNTFVDLPTGHAARLWGRTGCQNSTGKFSCLTGYCGTGDIDCAITGATSAATLVEFTFNGTKSLDWYNVSVVNGYNVPVSVYPLSGKGSSCLPTGCIFNVSHACPSVLKLGMACRSACDVFGTPRYCCTGGSQCGAANYSVIYKKSCPQAVSFPQDNATTTYSCAGSPFYAVTFCPSSIKEVSGSFQLVLLPPPPPPPPPTLPPPPSSPTPWPSLSVSPAPTFQPSPSLSPPQAPSLPPPKTNSLRKKKKRLPTSVLVALPTSIAISILLLFAIWICTSKKKTPKRNEEIDEIKTTESLQFDIDTIRTATNNFSSNNKLGEGGFGEVCKGKLENGQEVAVKRLLQASRQGVTEFKTEVVLVAKLQHKNLVKLLGYSMTLKEKILVYEFLPNSSLDRFLFDNHVADLTRSESLDWQIRFNIIVGIARGLLYLHEDSRLTVIHRDLKTSNILLDEAMNPKISDFGLAKLFGDDQSQGDTKRIVGTYGYMAPEYATTGHYSVKSDIYSFGVIMLEILSGQRNKFFSRQQQEEALLHRAWRLWNEKKPLDMVDATLNNDFPTEEVIRCIHIGLLCIQEDAVQRPRVRSILDALGRPSIYLPEPTPPRFFGISANPGDHHNNQYIYTGTETITELYTRS